MSARGEPRILASAPIWIDIVALEAGVSPALASPAGQLEASQAEKLASALKHYRGDLLLGWYDDWVLTERDRLRILCLEGYRRLMEHYAAAGDIDNALAAGLAAVRIEPLRERVQQRVLELYSLSGQRVEAIRHYERFKFLLKSELAIAPARSTRELIERIKAE
jgi:DNA-binding SARP family transcriptional activator